MRLAGVLLFLPVPLVLWLFTRFPLGPLSSLGVGGVLMLTHRFYARRFALSRALSRCLYCGRGAAEGPTLWIREPAGETTWRFCKEGHALLLRRVLAWAEAHEAYLKVGILGSLLLFFPGVVLSSRGRLGPVTTADVVNGFRLSIALTVLPLGFLGPRASAPHRTLRVPFPLHIQALIGSNGVFWLFRIIGLFWFLLSLAYFQSRLNLRGMAFI